MIGVGSAVGAGVFVLTGTVAAQYAGPAVTLSYLISAVACMLTAACREQRRARRVWLERRPARVRRHLLRIHRLRDHLDLRAGVAAAATRPWHRHRPSARHLHGLVCRARARHDRARALHVAGRGGSDHRCTGRRRPGPRMAGSCDPLTDASFSPVPGSEPAELSRSVDPRRRRSGEPAALQLP